MNLQQVNSANFSGVLGDTFSVPVKLVKEGFDWTGINVLIEVKERPQGQAIYSSTKEVQVVDGNGSFVFDLLPTQTESLSPKQYYYDFQVLYAVDDVKTPVRGIIDFAEYHNTNYNTSDTNDFVIEFLESEGLQIEFVTAGIGKSAYQHWLDEGNTGSVSDFLASLTQQIDPNILGDYDRDFAQDFLIAFNT